jgi:hypothetical protein
MILDFATAVQTRPDGIFSQRPIGNSLNLDKWDVARMQSLYGGITAVHTAFYEEFSKQTLARLILCVGMQESTGDFALNVPYGQSQGFMQASPASVVQDFNTYGQTIHSRHRPLVPGDVDVADPGTSVMLWGWYGNVVAHTGVSVAEYVHRAEWDIDARRDRPNLAHALLGWLAGPSATLDDGVVRAHFKDYFNRVMDYWLAAGFGTQGFLQSLVKRRLQGNVTHVVERDDFLTSLLQ